jgi:hypothetical protein
MAYTTGYPTFSSYFDPNSQYGGNYAPGDWAQTGVGGGFGGYLESPANWDATFTRHLGTLGIPENSAEADFARRNYGKYVTGYKSALATRPDLKIQDYFANHTDIRRDFLSATPSQRGETPGLFSGRARTIARG